MTWLMRIVDVVHDHAEVVGRRAVGAHEDPVVELLVLEHDGAVDEVVHDGGAGVGDAQAQGAGGEPAVPAAAGVAERLLARLGRLALGVELLGRAVAVVRAAGLHQPRGRRPVQIEALGLAIAGRRRPLVPVEAEPPERVDDELDVLVGRARAVGVLDAQDEDAAVVAREQPVEQRRAGAADVQVAGRARREPYAHLPAHRPRTTCTTSVRRLMSDHSTPRRTPGRRAPPGTGGSPGAVSSCRG